jgi:hypothetical protein
MRRAPSALAWGFVAAAAVWGAVIQSPGAAGESATILSGAAGRLVLLVLAPAAAVWLAWLGLVAAKELSDARRGPRRRAGRCLTCGYSLRGNVSGVCPECGTPVERIT